MHARNTANALRYREDSRGHYESYFQRANHPTRPLAFWIRYTIFSPKGRADAAVGELWAVYFDGELGQIAAAKQVVPWASCQFSREVLEAQIGDSSLSQEQLSGSASGPHHNLSWKLSYDSPEPPLLLLPDRLYETSFPKAKALVGSPQARFNGELMVNDQRIAIDDWVGSQNHNWGQKHTDRYAWGQVAGFDGVPEAFLECATASIRVGPLYTPPMSPVVLRLGAEEFRFASAATGTARQGQICPFFLADPHAQRAGRDRAGVRRQGPPTSWRCPTTIPLADRKSASTASSLRAGCGSPRMEDHLSCSKQNTGRPSRSSAITARRE